MIVSASRRTDIPAFYAQWFINRLRAGWCEVANPFNSRQISRVDLTPPALDCLVFWTRHPRPLFHYLREMEDMGLAYYFLYTLTAYPRVLDARGPGLEAAVRGFRELADRIGPHRVRWRYDPIVFARGLEPDDHRRRFEMLARRLEGATEHVIVSVLEPYAKIRRRAGAVPGMVLDRDLITQSAVALLPDLAALAREYGMAMAGCALWEGVEHAACAAGIVPSRCVDPELVSRLTGEPLAAARDTNQRSRCGCAPSRDIGVYDSCGFGCVYCYATRSFATARRNRHGHDPSSPSLPGSEPQDQTGAADQHSLFDQGSAF